MRLVPCQNVPQLSGEKEMSEPVAWMSNGKEFYVQKNYCPDFIPLYTHPVKELTDEEIRHIQAICHLKDVGYDNFIMRFARAILRKAQNG
jgi:hypothetical protein